MERPSARGGPPSPSAGRGGGQACGCSVAEGARLALEYSLANFLWKQAVFFAERLAAECPGEESAYLLAMACFHGQDASRAHWLLQGNPLPKARYLLARCCLQLERWTEAEEALTPESHAWTGSLAEVANGAAGLCLLGQVKERLAKHDQAAECYAKCLELCPFMWEAYERWSWLVLRAPAHSRPSAAGIAASVFGEERFAQALASIPLPRPQWPPAPLCPPPARPVCQPAPQLPAFGAAPRSSRELLHRTPPAHRDPPGPADLGAARRQLLAGEGETRRAAARGEPLHRASPPRDAAGCGPGGVSPRKVHGQGGFAAPEAGSEVSLASLCCKLGTALHAMHRFESSQAVRLLQELPGRHYRTGYVLGLVALCYFEAAEYEKAEAQFKEVRRIEPRRLEGLEYYSSALWQLGRGLELGRLARQCLDGDRSKPQVWCVVGNCFSLQREHETAAKFLRRAMQVDGSFAYAYTLCGHEYAAEDKFDKAMQMYEQALAVDPRHYNAWWGLGNVYSRQESHENARYHFLKALEINRSNAVLRRYLEMALGSLGETSASLDSVELDEDEATPSPRHRRAGGAGAPGAPGAVGAPGSGRCSRQARQKPRAAPVPAAPATSARAGRAF